MDDAESTVESEPLPPLDDLQNELVRKHLDTADRVAYIEWNKARHALDLDELKSLSYLGLMKAVRRWYGYCEERNFSPNDTQYFYIWSRLFMKGAIMDTLRKDDKWAGRGVRSKSKKLKAAGQDAGATVHEMAERSGLSEKEVNDTLNTMSQRPVSLEAEDIDTEVVQSVESSVLVLHLLETLVSVISSMDEVTQTILALHYYQERQLQDIAKILGITEHYSSDLHTKSITTIRTALADATIGVVSGSEEIA